MGCTHLPTELDCLKNPVADPLFLLTPVLVPGPDFTTADFDEGGSIIECHLTNSAGTYSTFTIDLPEAVWHESDADAYETCIGSTARGANDAERSPFQGTIHNFVQTYNTYDAA